MSIARAIQQRYQSSNDLVRVSVAVVVVFGALLLADSFGAPGMLGVALIIAAGVALAFGGN